MCEDEFTRTNHALSRQNHDITELRAELRREVERLTLKVAEKANADDLQGFKLSTGAAGDWKTLAINLRRELAEKASKEDLSLTFTEHTEAITEKLAKLTTMIEEKVKTALSQCGVPSNQENNDKSVGGRLHGQPSTQSTSTSPTSTAGYLLSCSAVGGCGEAAGCTREAGCRGRWRC